MIKGDAIVFTNGILNTENAKTCHGLLRGSSRFNILGVIDAVHVGRDAGEVMDGRTIGVKIYGSVSDFLQKGNSKPKYFILGVAFHGGKLPKSCRPEVLQAIKSGISIVSGLHQFLNDDEKFKQAATEHGVDLIDVRKPPTARERHFWDGSIYNITTPKIAVLGMDCALGKRTTCRFLYETCNNQGIKTEMIYTGQTGWMQGYSYGFIFDATTNDFIGGAIEKAIKECDKEVSPDLILIEGQASLRNPSGPCGSEFLLSGNTKGVILQHAPVRKYFIDYDKFGCVMPSVESEIQLIKMYGAETLAITLSEEGLDNASMEKYQRELTESLSIPVIRPLKEGVGGLLPVIREFINRDYL